MPEELQILDLAPDLPDDVEALDLLSVQDLDRDLVLSDLVEPDCNKKAVLKVRLGTAQYVR